MDISSEPTDNQMKLLMFYWGYILEKLGYLF